MPRYSLTVTFTSDRDLTKDEFADLLDSIWLQVEEPQTRETDEDSLDIFVDATYSTSNIVINHDFS